MTPEEFFERISAHRLELARASVKRLGVYGAVACGEAGPESDVDILFEFERLPDLYEFAALKERLSEILDRPVSLMTPQVLRPRLRSRVLHEVRYSA